MAKQLMKGNEAFAHAALEAGVRVVAGYPGTPSSEVIETVAKLHAQGKAQGVHVEWSTNEKAALELLAGASYAGARCLYTCKQVGLNVASDPLMSLNYVGVKGGVVLLVADDPGPISSQTEQDTRRFAAFAKVPVFDPGTPEEGFAMLQQAFEVSEKFHTPVLFRPTTRVCHASTFFEVAETTQAREAEGFTKDPKWVIFPKRSYKGHGEINTRLPQIAHEFSGPAFAGFNTVEDYGVEEGAAAPVAAASDVASMSPLAGTSASAAAPGAPTRAIVAGGISAAYAKEALALLKSRADEAGVAMPACRVVTVGTPYPFPAEFARTALAGCQEVLVLEELDHVLEDEILKLAGSAHMNLVVHGKLDTFTRDRGENDVADCAERIASFFTESLVHNAFSAGDIAGVMKITGDMASLVPAPPYDQESVDPLVPQRPPILCAGCPHRGAFYAVKKAVGKRRDARLCGDIGCYTLGNAMPLDAVDTCLCMGAGITVAQGFATVEPGVKAVSFVGDSTFFASGMTGVANAVYNQHDITIAVLDNATTAMTGSQPHPGTGVTLMGPKTKPISIEAVLRALGVECITHANPLYLEDAVAAAKEAIDFNGPSAIIFESPCTKLLKPDAPVQHDPEVCTGCKVCVAALGCPALSWDAEAGHPVVDASLCVGCGLCTDLCKDGALTCAARTEHADEPRFRKPCGSGAAGEEACRD